MARQRTIESILESEYITIGELVRITEERYSTLKYYTEEGLLPFEQEDKKLTRRYKRIDVINIINKINESKKEKLTIKEIKEKIIKKEL